MRTILVSMEDDYSVGELKALAKSGGAEVIGILTQNNDKPTLLTYIGSGKAEELKQMCFNMDAERVIFDCSLSPLQNRHLTELLGVEVIDKIQLILEIFADRAITKEAQLQVELSAYQYELPRLKGSFDHLSRLGGGIGTRGPGESKIDVKRNYYRQKIQNLTEELEKARENRSVQRKQRQKNGIPLISLVGYTNVGKTTLFNRLSDAGAYADNRLFATLDPLVRQVELEGQKFLLTDTVGFIRKIPTSLIASFRSTLEEIDLSSVLVHVCDVSDPHFDEHFRSVTETIKSLTENEVPTIYVYNKTDLVDEITLRRLMHQAPEGYFISVKKDENLDELIGAIVSTYRKSLIEFDFLIPYSKGHVISFLQNNANVATTDYEAEGTRMTGHCTEEIYSRTKAMLK